MSPTPIASREAALRIALAARALPTEESTIGEYITLHRKDIVEIYRLAE